MNALRYHAYEGMGICFVQSLASCKALATKRHECASSAALTVGKRQQRPATKAYECHSGGGSTEGLNGTEADSPEAASAYMKAGESASSLPVSPHTKSNSSPSHELRHTHSREPTPRRRLHVGGRSGVNARHDGLTR